MIIIFLLSPTGVFYWKKSHIFPYTYFDSHGVLLFSSVRGYLVKSLNSRYLQTGTLANSEYQDEMPHNVSASALFTKIKANLHDRNHILEMSTCFPLNYKMGS